MQEKSRNIYAAFVIVTLGIAFLLDIKYKGLVYQLFAPKKVHSENS